MAIGGNEDKRPLPSSILGTFVRRAGGADARIVIIPSASVEPDVRAATYAHLFRELGAAAVHAERGGVSDADRDAIRAASGIFVTGGDQVKLMEHLRLEDCVEPIREAVRRGAVYAGTSAGASAASETMIAYSEDDYIVLEQGIGLIPHAIIDQHFGERQRLPRLEVAARAHQLTGVGIDENTAMVWSGDGQVSVEGAGSVTVVDPSGTARHLLLVRQDRSFRP
jgi:cyanophycinase